MKLRNIIFISAALLSGSLFAESGPPKVSATPNAAHPANAANTANVAKTIKTLPPAEPEVPLSVFVFDSTKNPSSGVDVTQNGKLWGSCKWGDINAQPVSGQPATKVCKFAAPRGTKVNLTQLPGSVQIAGWQCNPAGSGACYKTPAFELAREGHIEAAFNIKP